MPESVSLLVSEAYRSDTPGRKIVRVDQATMKKLGIETGDFVKVKSQKSQVIAVVWPLHSEDEDTGIIRMDGYLRWSLGVSVGDYVDVEKADNVKPAEKIVFAPLEKTEPFTIDFYLSPSDIKEEFIRKPLTQGELVLVQGEIPLVVVQTKPVDNVYVTDKTVVELRKEPVKENEFPVHRTTRVTWEDIGDLEEAKEKIREIAELPMRHPEVFKRLGIEPPKGILLYGPPGTGKTLLAKAVATESGANFITVRGPEVLSKWVGESEKAVRKIFERAREVAPTVVFFDEIDSIAPARGFKSDTTGVTDRIVNQLLTELDGIIPLSNVVVIAATNRPDIIDPALLRPGRFDRLIYVPPPDLESRKQIFKIHLKKVPLANDVSIEKLASMTEGYTGADIAAVVREAVMIKLREKLEVSPVEFKHFELALKKVPPSLSRDVIMMYERISNQLKKISLQ
ncbi:MAG: AAA family ATPase [Caldisphaera sp.]